MMSDTEDAPTATPGPGKSVKFANPRQIGAMFPAFQSRCSIQEGLLTKALNSVKSSKDEFCLSLEGSSVLTIKRKADHLVDRMSNVTVRKSQLQRRKKGWSTGALLPEGNGSDHSWQKDSDQVYRTCRDF